MKGLGVCAGGVGLVGWPNGVWRGGFGWGLGGVDVGGGVGSWCGAVGNGCGCGAVWVGAPGVGISRWPGRGKRGLAPAAPRGAQERHPLQGISAGRPVRGNMTGIRSEGPGPSAHGMNPQADTLTWKPGPAFTPGGPSPAPTPESPGPVPLHEAPAWRPRPETPQSGIHPSESRPGIHSGKPRPGECHSSKLQVCASLKPGPSATTRSHDPALSPGSRRSASASPQLRWVVSPRGLGPVRLRGI